MDFSTGWWGRVRRLVREGLCRKPRTEKYVIGMFAYFGYYPSRETKTLGEELLADPELLWASTLGRVARVSPVHAQVVQLAIERSLRGDPHQAPHDRVLDLALEVGGQARVWRSLDDDDPRRVVRGVMRDLYPGQETTSLLISPEGWLINLLEIEDAEKGRLVEPPWCFVKTQFACLTTRGSAIAPA